MARFEEQVQTTAQARGVEVRIEQVEKLDDIEGALQRLSEEKVQAVIVPANGLLASGRKKIVERSLALRLPLIFAELDGVVAGGLASYGVDHVETYGRSAIYVDKILKGAAPGASLGTAAAL